MIMQQFGGAYEDQQLQAYVNDVGQRTAKASHRPELEYHFMVLDSEDINAFTTGGGYVYITRGIMNYLNSEAELAAVLGHEVGHVTARHPVRQQVSRRCRISVPPQSVCSPAARTLPVSPTMPARRWSAATAVTRNSRPIALARNI